MVETLRPHRIISFANFEVDLQVGELRRAGMRLKLTGQPFQVLAILLEHPGEVVTREELQKRLWPDTFVDVDHNLNTAINKIREVLGDSAEHPRFVETLARRGYRFIGPVNQPEPAPLEVDVRFEEKKESEVPRKTSAWKWWHLVIGAIALGVIFAAAYYWLRPLPPPRVLSYRELTKDHKQKNTPCGWSSHVVTDGPRVFFNESTSSVTQVSATGGDSEAISTPFKCFLIFDISPDKTELLGASQEDFAHDQPLWIFSLSGGLVRRLGSLKAHSASWSPDGRRIAYAVGTQSGVNHELYIADKDGTNSRKVAGFEQGYLQGVRWSRNGKILRFAVGGKLWQVSADGTNLHSIELPLSANLFLSNPNWTADGRYFVFAAFNPDQFRNEIWAFREPESFFGKTPIKPVELTTGAMNFWNPTPSPLGKQIFAIGGRVQGELVRYDLKSRRLEPFLSGISAEQVEISRDGKSATYVTFPEAVLWRSRVDGTERMQLTTPPLRAALPRWSPDGTRIAFAGCLGCYAQGWKIYIVSAEGGTPEVAVESKFDELDPTWFPNGDSLVFASSYYSPQTHIASIDMRTRQLTTIPGSGELYSPRLSPDGRFIVAMNKPGQSKLMLFDLGKQTWSQLFEVGHGGLGWPQWSGDSKYVYVRDAVDQHAPILYRVRISDRKVERLATLDIPNGLIGIWNGWMSTTPDGTPLLLRDLEVEEIYALDVDLP